jgi:hypothetical protein
MVKSIELGSLAEFSAIFCTVVLSLISNVELGFIKLTFTASYAQSTAKSNQGRINQFEEHATEQIQRFGIGLECVVK